MGNSEAPKAGTVWSISGLDGRAVILAGPFGSDEAPEYIIAPLYTMEQGDPSNSDWIQVNVDGDQALAALWNSRPAPATQLAERAGVVSDKDSLLDAYWAWMSEEQSPPLSGGRLSKWRKQRFRREEAERWQAVSAELLEPGRVTAESEVDPVSSEFHHTIPSKWFDHELFASLAAAWEELDWSNLDWPAASIEIDTSRMFAVSAIGDEMVPAPSRMAWFADGWLLQFDASMPFGGELQYKKAHLLSQKSFEPQYSLIMESARRYHVDMVLGHRSATGIKMTMIRDLRVGSQPLELDPETQVFKEGNAA